MLKVTILALALVGASLTSSAQIFEPEGLNMPGAWNSWVNPPNVPALGGIQVAGGTLLLNTQLPTRRYQTTIHVANPGGDITGGAFFWLFTSGPTGTPYANKWSNANVTINTLQTYTFGHSNNNTVTVTNGKYYTVNFRDVGYLNTDAIFMETSSVPMSITGVTQNPLPGSVTDADPVQVTVTTNANPSSEEIVYVRYSTDNFVTSSLLPVTIATMSGSTTIPTQTGGTSVKYYVMTTTVPTPSSDHDMYTIRHDNNGGSNYSYTVPAPVYTVTATAGPGGLISPSGGVAVTAGDSVTFTITALSGYTGDQLIIDGVPGPHQASYTFTNVNAAHTIHATFKAAVTFRVNMKVAMESGIFRPDLGDQVFVRGAFNSWGTDDELSDGDTDSIYTKQIMLGQNQTYAYKYFKTLRGGVDWETFGGDRSVGVDTLPLVLSPVYFSNIGPPVNVTFQVNMSVQMLEGTFDPLTDVVTVRGSFNDWGNSTNNPDTLSDGDLDSVYTKTIPLAASQQIQYKFWKSPDDYEPTVSNRIFEVPSGDAVIPVAFFDDDNVPGPPVIVANPTSIDFGTVLVGSFALDSIQVSNAGTIALSIASATGPDPQFAVVPNGPLSIAPGESFTFFVTFAPAAPGAKSGSIVFVHDATNQPTPYEVNVSGFGADTTNILLLSVTPDTLIAKDPIKGKPLKPVKRGKGYPNWANLMYEVVTQGGFQPGASESDSAGGMVIGISHMKFLGSKWKPDKDSSKVRAWVRLTKYNPSKGLGTSSVAIQKTLEDKTGTHTEPARGLDSTGNPGNEKRKPMVKEHSKLPPKKHNNVLFAQLVALKMNIAASQMGKIPSGFGDLIFDLDGNSFDEMSVMEISEKADSMMTYWKGYTPADYEELHWVVSAINAAFAGPLDTLSFEVDNKLVLAGKVALGSVSFMKAPSPFVPTRIDPTTTETESWEDEDFDDEEFEESATPVAAKLYQNYPNPFNPSTIIGFRLRETSLVSVRIYNLLGQEVATLLNHEELDAGYQTLDFHATGLSTGIYFYRIDAQGLEDDGFRTIEARKMLLVK